MTRRLVALGGGVGGHRWVFVDTMLSGIASHAEVFPALAYEVPHLVTTLPTYDYGTIIINVSVEERKGKKKCKPSYGILTETLWQML